MRWRTGFRCALVGVLAAGVCGFTSGPASALCSPPAGPPAADGKVRELPNGPFVGGKVYGWGEPQVVLRELAPGQKAIFEAVFRNRSDKSRGIVVVFASNPSIQNFRIKAFVGGVNVTDELFGDGFKLTGVAPRKLSAPVRIQVKMKKNANVQDSTFFQIRGNYKNQAPECGDGPEIVAGFFL